MVKMLISNGTKKTLDENEKDRVYFQRPSVSRHGVRCSLVSKTEKCINEGTIIDGQMSLQLAAIEIHH